ncbi:Ltp family lipoprotein [Lacticaseibacillus sharpeae]|uniref:Ltp family lipoprotein n=1 Tax=Lacticaseibacillus sharpeae TaxID=1626 RepID=UPI0021E734BF|nr:Ltp family lipoprotein [Lacticaseibacillus sharpeae]
MHVNYKKNAAAAAITLQKREHMSAAAIEAHLASDNGEKFTKAEAAFAVDQLHE